jgi:hypothetical protein
MIARAQAMTARSGAVKHGRCAMADRFRVRIDLDRIQSNVLAYEGGRLSELQIRNWLRSVGFTPHADGTWVGDQDCLDRLHRTEILELCRVPGGGADRPVIPRTQSCG